MSLPPQRAGATPAVFHKRDEEAMLAVYVGRPTAFGNPFVIGRDGSRSEVIAKFEAWLLSRPELVERAKRELRGRDLSCWCAPAPCHADVLLRVANSPPSQGGVSE